MKNCDEVKTKTANSWCSFIDYYFPFLNIYISDFGSVSSFE